MSTRGERVTFASTNKAGEGRGVLFQAPNSGPGTPALIVIHEWWGMNDQIQTKGAEMAREGDFTVLVPDFYRGRVATDREEAGHLMHGLDWDGALSDISGGTRFLRGRAAGVRVGVVGFCMGGALALAAAARCPEVSAASPFYGLPPHELADLTTIKIPLQAHFAERDEVAGFSSPADYEPVRASLERAGVPMEWFTYDAGHGFTNPENQNYDKERSEQAIRRLYGFMRKHLDTRGGTRPTEKL